MRFPERGIGVEQYRARLSKVGIDPDALAPDPQKINELRLLAMLEELHKAGVLDDEEFAAKRAVVERSRLSGRIAGAPRRSSPRRPRGASRPAARRSSAP